MQSRQIATDLAAQGYDIHHTTNKDAMFETILMRPDAWCFLIFDLDLMDGLEADLDDLMSFRQNCSTIPILLTGSVIRDDLPPDLAAGQPLISERMDGGENLFPRCSVGKA